MLTVITRTARYRRSVNGAWVSAPADADAPRPMTAEQVARMVQNLGSASVSVEVRDAEGHLVGHAYGPNFPGQSPLLIGDRLKALCDEHPAPAK
jgi:hypothetical protein